jgi:hypothetical protein
VSDTYDLDGNPISRAQWMWLSMGADPQGGPDRSMSGRGLDPLAVTVEESMEALMEVLDTDEGAGLSANPEEQRRERLQVALSTVGAYTVSTVWVGVHTGQGRSRPMIYETMLFDDSGATSLDDLACWRYPSRAAAFSGHQKFLAELCARAGLPLP